MKKLLVISYSGFSDQDANGITLKSILGAWTPENLMQFYCGEQAKDFGFCHHYFHVTDSDVLKSMLFKRAEHYSEFYDFSTNSGPVIEKNTGLNITAIKKFLKKHKYNFILRTLREYLWILSPWGKEDFMQCVDKFNPDAILYMVGESFALDRLVLQTAKRFSLPIILFNTEAYRIIDLNTRVGLEKYFYKLSEKSYKVLQQHSDIVFFNSRYLMEHYSLRYNDCSVRDVLYNSDVFNTPPYRAEKRIPEISYFGNLGVGRAESLLDVADALNKISNEAVIHVYGNLPDKYKVKFESHKSLCCHGFVTQQKLAEVKENSDILIHVESFDAAIMPKLRFAFSTKIAQYLCAGRCVLSYAPDDMASTQYLKNNGCAMVVSSKDELPKTLYKMIYDSKLRESFASKALSIAKENHDINKISVHVMQAVESL